MIRQRYAFDITRLRATTLFDIAMRRHAAFTLRALRAAMLMRAPAATLIQP